MSQHDIITLLNKHRGRRYSVQQLGKELGYGKNNLSYSVAVLIRFRLVKTGLVRTRMVKGYRGTQYSTHQTVRKIWL